MRAAAVGTPKATQNIRTATKASITRFSSIIFSSRKSNTEAGDKLDVRASVLAYSIK